MSPRYACRKFILAGAAVFALASVDTAHAGFAVFHSFAGGSDGSYPGARVRDLSGNFYGTTSKGGSTGCQYQLGCGTVFKLAPDGTETLLYVFAGTSDGAYPEGGLIRDAAGNLYGTTSADGNSGCDNGLGCGTVFKLAPDGTETVLHAFAGGSDGADPWGPVIEDTAGNLYGMTVHGGGGTGCHDAEGCGTVFQIAPDGTETVLHAFAGGSDGAFPQDGLIADPAGNLYGTTPQGGNSSCNGSGCGTVFKLATDGTETVLYAFLGGSDGDYPIAGVTMDSAGNLYGTTFFGGKTGRGCGGGCGTVFELSADGTETVLHAFTGSDGIGPEGGLIKDAADNLYGTTSEGGGTSCKSYGCGTVFKLATDGTETVLHTFRSKTGSTPDATLISSSGHLYGATLYGGEYNRGTVFVLKK